MSVRTYCMVHVYDGSDIRMAPIIARARESHLQSAFFKKLSPRAVNEPPSIPLPLQDPSDQVENVDETAPPAPTEDEVEPTLDAPPAPDALGEDGEPGLAPLDVDPAGAEEDADDLAALEESESPAGLEKIATARTASRISAAGSSKGGTYSGMSNQTNTYFASNNGAAGPSEGAVQWLKDRLLQLAPAAETLKEAEIPSVEVKF